MSYRDKLIKILKTFPEVCKAISNTKMARGFKRHHISLDGEGYFMDVMVDFILDGDPKVIFYRFSSNTPDILITDDDVMEHCAKEIMMNFFLRPVASKSIKFHEYVKYVIMERVAKQYAKQLEVDFIYGEDLLNEDEFNIKDILE